MLYVYWAIKLFGIGGAEDLHPTTHPTPPDARRVGTLWVGGWGCGVSGPLVGECRASWLISQEAEAPQKGWPRGGYANSQALLRSASASQPLR